MDKSSIMKQRARCLRRNMTDAERHLWSVIRNRQLNNFKFRRQHLLGNYIIDFICIEAGLIIEIDGGQHAENKLDMKRTSWLEQQGYRVLRFWNNEVLQNRDTVLEEILKKLQE